MSGISATAMYYLVIGTEEEEGDLVIYTEEGESESEGTVSTFATTNTKAIDW